MKRLLNNRWANLASLALIFLCAEPRSRAFPPAPHHTFFGLVRNQFGEPIDVATAIVYLQVGNSAAVKASIAASKEPGVNYRLAVPMDAGASSDPYIATALRKGEPVQLRVKIGSVNYLPIEMALTSKAMGQPGGSTRLDLTLGEDSDGDGLPDAWEKAIIAVRGGTLASITPDGDADGDGISNLQEYLAGTYAFDPNDGFRLGVSIQSSGDPRLEFLAIRGRTYAIQGSADLQHWNPVTFQLISGQTVGPSQELYVSQDVRFLQITVPRQPGSETNRFFKAVVQ